MLQDAFCLPTATAKTTWITHETDHTGETS